MLIYLEKKAKNYPETQRILEKFQSAQILEIDNYKNIFDKNFWDFATEQCFIIAKNTWANVLAAPHCYGYAKNAFFFKTSLNCLFDCSYCYLKWAFKNSFPVIFVDYDGIKNDILKVVEEAKNESHCHSEQKCHPEFISASPKDQHTGSPEGDAGDPETSSGWHQGYEWQQPIWFYSSDYSDIQAFSQLTSFNEEFIPFFEKLKNVFLEIRTKSANISNLLNLPFVPKNTEIAFSLNPEQIITEYEHKTASLEDRVEAINKLLKAGFLVWIRFVPLLPVDNYLEVYEKFITEIVTKIDFSQINSIIVGWLLYTQDDYKEILRKNPVDIFYKLEKDSDWFVREKLEVRNEFYKLFKKYFKDFWVCFDLGR